MRQTTSGLKHPRSLGGSGFPIELGGPLPGVAHQAVNVDELTGQVDPGEQVCEQRAPLLIEPRETPQQLRTVLGPQRL